MLRALSLFLPMWPVDLLHRRDRMRGRAAAPGETILLVRTERQRPIVAACCGRALQAGVSVGMTVADARALIRTGHVRIEPLRPDRDAAALESLARWAVRFSPLVAVDPPDGLLLNITGCGHLFRGERRLVQMLLKQTERLGCVASAAVAPTFAGAWSLARFVQGNPIIDDRAGIRAALAPLPIRALRLAEPTVVMLAEVGIVRIGELMNLPRATIPSRFGLVVLDRLDRAVGLATETIEPVRPREPILAERVLDGPTTDLHVLGIVVRRLLETVVETLTTNSAGARRLRTTFDRPRLDPIVVEVIVGRPSRDVKHLWSLLSPRLERIPMGNGIDRVEMDVPSWARLRDRQATSWVGVGTDENDEAPAEVERLCDTIANRIGRERVCTIRLHDTHIPERSWRIVPRHARHVPSPPVATLDRPTLLLPNPESIRTIAGSGDSPPWRIAWRGHDLIVTTAVGPERIAEAWWHASGGPAPDLAMARDYFKVQDERGRWLWVFRETNTNRWFVHGLWA